MTPRDNTPPISHVNLEASATPSPPRDWYDLSPSAAQLRQGTPKDGLTEVMVAERREAVGANTLPVAERPGLAVRLFAQVNNALIWVLLGAAAITALTGHWTDVWIILGVVVVNAAIGLWQEGKAENALAAVRDMLAPTARVRRAGMVCDVSAADLVPGDLVLLEAGDRVPADLRILTSRSLRAEEAALTGEAVPVEKCPEAVPAGTALHSRTSMLFAGTIIASGRATGLVVATGERSEIGRIGAMLTEIETGSTPLIETMNRFAKGLTVAVLALCVTGFIFAVGARDYTFEEAFFAMLGMAVASIPEGLPAVITITLALGVQRLAGRRAIVRKLPAVETLGAVSVICTDKTGTLTQNEMTVRSLRPAEFQREIEVSGNGYDPRGKLLCDEQGREGCFGLLHSALATSEADLLCDDATGRWRATGDPMDAAIVALGHKADAIDACINETRIDELPFDSVQKFNAVLNESLDGNRVIHVKGAPERVLQMCAHEARRVGSDPLEIAPWEARIATMAAQGQRVLGFARKHVTSQDSLDAHRDFQEGFEFLGLAGFVDPPRPEARASVAECRAAGIDVTMITGDHAATAHAIAQDLGITPADGTVVQGSDIDAMDDDTLRQRIATARIFARATPAHKLRLIKALRHDRSVIAMTGDGVNDAPALKQADVGVAMGIKGTEAAKSASDVVLADDNFATIAAAVREGRVIYDNIRKVVAWTLPTNMGEALIILAAILTGAVLPLEATHILWINMVTAVALGLTLAFDPAEIGVMARAPRRPDDPMINRAMLWQMCVVAGLMAISAYGVFQWSLARGDEVACARCRAGWRAVSGWHPLDTLPPGVLSASQSPVSTVPPPVPRRTDEVAPGRQAALLRRSGGTGRP
ncbi:MAG: HAD-IC family P-type ATPase [Aestuariivita sp.]|jgi:magnesium-transporting ATPase (P-type)|nr:HAD-IC family P-type ATPase [Aestuariivita sp.]